MAPEASGNPVGIIMPRPSVDPTPADALSAHAYRSCLAEIETTGTPFQATGVVELAPDQSAVNRMQQLDAMGALEPVGGRIVQPAEASRVSGLTLDRPAILYREAGWLRPTDWVAGLSGREEPAFGMPVRTARWDEREGYIRLEADLGASLADAAAVVFAGGALTREIAGLDHLPVVPVRGHLSRLTATPQSERLRAGDLWRLSVAGGRRLSCGRCHL